MTKPYYTRIALAGIALYLFIEFLVLVATLVFGPLSELWYPFLVGGLIIAGGATIYFWHPWGLVVGLLGGLVGILFSLDSIGQNLSSPDSFLDFTYRPVFWSAGTLLLLVGSIAGLLQHFRHRSSPSGPPLVTHIARGVVAVVAILTAYSAVATVTGIDRVSAADKQGAVIITAHGTKFDMDTLHAVSGGTTKIVVRNDDPIVHTFTVDGLGIDVKVGPRSEKLIELDGASSGTYQFHCRITGHSNMRGTLTVD